MSSNKEWKNDGKLEKDLNQYVAQNLKRAEILDFAKRDYPEYHWSLPTLARRLKFFDISYIRYDTDIESVKNAIKEELNGSGKLLRYRAMNQKLRTKYDVKVPRHLVHKIMQDIDPDGLKGRSVTKKKNEKKIPFTCDGPMSVLSLHCPVWGYDNWTFPLRIYGCLDTFSRKTMFLYVCSNSDPKVIGQQYLKFLTNYKMLPRHLRVDRDSETDNMATIQAYLADQLNTFEDPLDAVIYGKSTSNEIERWWIDLHERLEMNFKFQLQRLLNSRQYDPHNEEDRQILAYVYIPFFQQECDNFLKQWNSHRIRAQKDLELPTGVPNHMFDFPEGYGGTLKGIPIPSNFIDEVTEASGLGSKDAPYYYMSDALMKGCTHFLPEPETLLSSNEAEDAYLYLKHKLKE